jgi:hypothetical protein
MAKVYKLEKEIWTEADFEEMSWEDSTIQAFSYNKEDEFLLDIDYIFEWIEPKEEKDRYFKYWIAPCTLIFQNVHDLVLNIGISAAHHRKIDNVLTGNPQRPKNAEQLGKELEYDWIIETTNGEISFKATGYNQYVRQQPRLLLTNELELDVRGGISFGTAMG